MGRLRDVLSRLGLDHGAADELPVGAVASSGREAVIAVEKRIQSTWIGDPLGADRTRPADALAAALGEALCGVRVSTWLEGPQVAGAVDVLAMAVGRSAPMTIYAAPSAPVRHATGGTASHEALHVLAGTGAIVLVAGTVQELIDLAVAARHIAERALIPVVVGLDAERVGNCVQDVSIPTQSQLTPLVGQATDSVESSGAVQLELLGRWRRRVPRWLNIDRPAGLGGPADPITGAMGAVARRIYCGDRLPGTVRRGLARTSEQLGRELGTVNWRGPLKATTVAVGIGAGAALAGELALRTSDGFGALAITCLAPLPTAAILSHLGRADRVAVLERVAPPLHGEPPLATAIRATTSMALENARTAGQAFPALPSWPSEQAPSIVSTPYGAGGLPLSAAALRTVLSGTKAPAVGLVTGELSADYPKRQAKLGDVIANHGPLWRLGPARSKDEQADDRVMVAVPVPVGSSLARVLLDGAALHVRCDTEWRSGAWWQVVVASTARIPELGEQATVDEWSVSPEDTEHADDHLLGAMARLVCDRLRPEARDRMLAAAFEAQCSDNDPALIARTAAFTAGLDDARPVAPVVVDAAPEGLPMEVRRHKAVDGLLGNLPVFWDTIGAPLRDGRADLLAAEPALTAGITPPLSAALGVRPPAANRPLPVLQTELCTGCGDCWTACPDSAIGAVALSFKALIDGGIAAAEGQAAGSLRSLSKKVAARATTDFGQAETAPATAAGALEPALVSLIAKLPEKRRGALTDGCAPLIDALGALPIVRAAPFFEASRADRPDDAEILGLTVDPSTCKGCGACVAACEPGALTAQDRTVDIVAAARTAHQARERLPDTGGATLERVRQDDRVGEAAATLLSRHCTASVYGRDDVEPGSGPKHALRLLLATIEAVRQPAIARHVEDVHTLRETLGGRIRDALIDTLPSNDIELLAVGLRGLRESDQRLSSLAGRFEKAHAGGRIDIVTLRRIVAMAGKLSTREWLLPTGETGLGRARAVLVLTSGGPIARAAAFESSSIGVPHLTCPASDAAQTAAAVQRVLVREAIEAARLCRSARAELDQKTAELPQRWDELTEAEQALCTPVVLLGNATDAGLVATALSSEGPICVALLTDGSAPSWQPPDGVYVAHSSIGAVDHFVTSVREALRFPGPAALTLLAPNPRTQGVADDAAASQARDLVAAGEFGLTCADPGAANGLQAPQTPPEPAVEAAPDPSVLAAHRASWTAEIEARVARNLLTLAGYYETTH